MDYSGSVSDAPLWIFGYGSLVWRPAFAHRRALPAAISGWARRFWQGSTDHRGVPSRPGRVVTLLSTDAPELAACESAGHVNEPCWGTAYEVAEADRASVLSELDHRERGGYTRIDVEIELRIGEGSKRVVDGLVYVADAANTNYLGPAPLDAIAQQILTASGPSGPNPQYVFELARSLRGMNARDSHVFAVETALARLVRESLR
jgi:cation transport protein ChaC